MTGKMRVCTLIGLCVLCVVLTSCVPNDGTCTLEDPAGFWSGLWHCMIAWLTFIMRLFNKNTNIYEIFNNGGWYNFGFLLGSGSTLFGLFRSSSKKDE